MNTLYLLTSPAPVIPGTDAVFQEVGLLRKDGGGEVLNLFPLKRPSRWFPKALYGIQHLRDMDTLRANHDVFHIFYPFVYDFPFLKQIKRPIIYTVTAGLSAADRQACLRAQPFIHTIIVSNDRDLQQLKAWGVTKARLIQPGFDATPWANVQDRLPDECTLLVGSAPWTRGQFKSKGIVTLLEMVRLMPELRLVFLWRGMLEGELRRLIGRFGVGDRVEVINRKTDVAKLLSRVHATIVLADSPRIVKAFPHSLLESLGAGRPVVVSQAIPMADLVRDKQCGVVAGEVSSAAVQEAVTALQKDYESFCENAAGVAATQFSKESFLAEYRQLYADIRSFSR